jgi:Fungal Zn(2)-Cys(6) binuclear cluster domain
MNSLEPSLGTQGRSQPKASFACVRCSERKVKCNRQIPCESCIRHNVECIFRQPKPSRRRRELAKDKTVDERLKRYEALLREKGIDPNQVTGTSEPEHHLRNTGSRAEGPEKAWILPLQSTIFKPRLLQGQGSTELVDK